MDIETRQAKRKPKDRDFIETQEGFLFCVVGYLHPPDKYTAYLKYSPASEGRWQRQGKAYHRELAFYHSHQVQHTLEYLQTNYPHYVHYCPVRNIHFSMVPDEWVHTYYYPEQRLAEVMANPNDRLEEEMIKVVEGIRQVAGISPAEMGVTGSILLGIHDPTFSDIDLIVFGRENTRKLREVMIREELPGVFPLNEAYVDEWCQGVVSHFGLTYSQARWLISRRWNFVYFGQERHIISLHPTRCDEEIEETYGDHYYRDAGRAQIGATIASSADALFLPAIYGIEKVNIVAGPHVTITEICAYEGLFGQIGEVGQKVVAKGKLEQVDGGPLHRLVIGSSHRSGREYLLPVGV
jgi:uncharacterized protein